MATTSSTLVVQSQIRNSKVGNFGCGRISHQIFVGSSIHPELISVSTYLSYADAESTLRFLLTGEISSHGVKYKITPNEWGLIVIFKNFLINLDLDWDTSGVQEVMKLQIQDKIDDRDKVISKLPKYQQDIANMAGTSRETVSRMLKLLEDKSLISRKAHTLSILDYTQFRNTFM